MAHKMHNKKRKPPMKEIPQNEVLQPYIKTGKALQHYFIGSATTVDYTSDLEQVRV